MAVQPLQPASSQKERGGSLTTWLFGILCFGSLAVLLALITMQVVNPPPAHLLLVEQDVALPASLPDRYIPDLRNIPPHPGPLTAGVSIRFDHFDFQALDPNTKLLFVSHTGPAPDRVGDFRTGFDPDKNANLDGNVVVFDTQQKKLIKRLDIPQVAGMVAAPDLGHVYAVDSNDNLVYDINEHGLSTTTIQLDDNESPDSIDYDQIDHKLFVSDVGAPAPNAKDQNNPSPDNQNISVIDLRTRAVSKINIGHLPKLPAEDATLVKFGYDVAHNKYDPTLHRLFVTIRQLTDQGILPSPPDPPAGTGELAEIDTATQRVIARLQMPKTCGIPHGLNVDAQTNIAYIACTQADPDQHLSQNLIRVQLSESAMTLMPGQFMPLAAKPDIVVLDHKLQRLFVGCNGGVSVFDVHNKTLTKLGDYNLGKGTHTIMVNDATDELYLPQPDIGGRPTLRIAVYDPNGQ